MLSIAFTILFLIIVKIWSYSTLRRQSTDLSSTYDTMLGNPHRSFPQHFSTPCGKLCRGTPERLAQGTTVSYYTSKCSEFLRISQVHMIHEDVSFYTLTDSEIYAILRRVLAVEINCRQGECRLFSWEVIPLTLYLNFNISWEICNV